MISILLLLTAAAIPPKPWTPGVCKVQRVLSTDAEPHQALVSGASDYIAYCSQHQSRSTVPACPVPDPHHGLALSHTGSGKDQTGGKEFYYELFDCQWHAGPNPRGKK